MSQLATCTKFTGLHTSDIRKPFRFVSRFHQLRVLQRLSPKYIVNDRALKLVLTSAHLEQYRAILAAEQIPFAAVGWW